MIQIRNVPDEVHRQLKARAALEGLSMSDYILRELRWCLERPSWDVVSERIASYGSLELDPSPTQLLREERDRG